MIRYGIVVWVIFLLLTRSLPAFEGVAKIKKVDPEKGILVLQVGDKERVVKADKRIKVLDGQGKELAGGLKSKKLTPGILVTITGEQENGAPVIKAIRLATKGTGNSQEKSSVGLKPLSEMSARDRYKGEDGGLYGGGKNQPPAAHQKAAQKEARRITLLDADGKRGGPSKQGKIVFISIGMSNTAGEFAMFKKVADLDPEKSPQLVIVNCAVGGAGAASWAKNSAGVWSTVAQRLKDAKVSPQQVQVAWIKHADPGPSPDTFRFEYAKKLEAWLASILNIAKSKYPNLRVAYLSSRIYGGYNAAGIRRVNPEPFAYESAFSVRWLIQAQIKGDRKLNYDPKKGKVVAPILLWGPYLWADGITPRQGDGLVWERKDLGQDGVHPSQTGGQKVAKLLLQFFKTDDNTKKWFLKR
jgi:hypothetical protein